MTADANTLERELVGDLSTVAGEIADDRLWQDLYKALANTAWQKPGSGEGHVTLSWKRAEEVVNGLAGEQGEEPTTLAQTGGEGEVSPRIKGLLGRLGWTARPEDTSRHDERHVDSPPDPPPTPDQSDAHAWEREAHAEADEEQRRRIL